MTRRAKDEAVFPDSETGLLCSAIDWSQTSLGAPSAWSPALRAIVSLAMRSKQPMLVAWGPQLVTLYNDAYIAILGAKHPHALGQPMSVVWAEVWDTARPINEAVMRGESLWFENMPFKLAGRAGSATSYFSFSYTPLLDGDGAVSGLFCSAIETTETVEANERKSEEIKRQRRLFEQAPGFICTLHGPDHVFDFVNVSYQRLFGRSDIVGKPVREVFPELRGQGFLELLDQVYSTGERYVASSIPVRVKLDHGGSEREFLLDFVYAPILDDGGRVTGIFCEGHDVTAAHESARKLAEREEQLRLATENGEIGLWDVDVVSDTLYWQPRVKAMFGIPPERPVSMKDFYEGLHPDDREATTAAFKAALDPSVRALYDVEYRTVGQQDRRVRWVAAKGRGVFDANGRCVRVIGTAIDITARKLAEARLRVLNEDLERRVSEALTEKKVLADIVEGTNAFVQVADMQYRWLAINKAAADEFERIFGIRPEVGQSMLEVLREHPRHQADVRQVWDRAFAGEEFTAVAEFGEAARDRRHYEMKFNVLRDAGGRQIGAYQFVFDVTERVLGQQRLARAEEALRQAQKMEAVGQLTGGIAHDFNNILHAVQGSLQLIQRLPGDRRVGDWAENALRSVRRGAEVTARLLTFSRRQQLDTKVVVAADLIEGMRDMLKHSLGPLVDLRFDLRSQETRITVDPTQLEMAILNLAVNARDAMPGGGTFSVTARERGSEDFAVLSPGRYIEIELRDTGSGMPPEVVARAFDPFFTTKDVGKGTGLGLSQVYGMARQAGGAAVIHSEVGRGTAVSLLLPVTDEAVSAPLLEARATEGAQRPAARVLVVDDDEEVRSALAASLEVLGHRVLAVADGAAAVPALNAFDPHALIVDFAMPGMNGAEVANRVRELRPRLPVIFASGYRDLPAIHRSVGNAAIVLRKPIALDELDRALTHALREISEAGMRPAG